MCFVQHKVRCQIIVVDDLYPSWFSKQVNNGDKRSTMAIKNYKISVLAKYNELRICFDL